MHTVYMLQIISGQNDLNFDFFIFHCLMITVINLEQMKKYNFSFWFEIHFKLQCMHTV